MKKQHLLFGAGAAVLATAVLLAWRFRVTPEKAQEFAAIPVQGLPALVYNPRKSVAAQAPAVAPEYQETR